MLPGALLDKYLFDILLSISLGIYPGIELLDHTVVIFEIFLRNHSSHAILHFCQHYTNIPVSLHSCQYLTVVYVFVSGSSNGGVEVIIVILICPP